MSDKKGKSRNSKVNGQRSGVESSKSEVANSCLEKLFKPGCWRSSNFLPALLLLLITTAAGAATIEGTVFDPSGRAVPRARISLLARATPLDEREADARGRYGFEGLRQGVYTLVANAPGFSAATFQVELREDETRAADLRLEINALEQHVVVSASLGGALAPQLGSSVNVVTAREMDDRGAQSIYEILRGVPGVEVNQTGRRGGVTGVFIRGGNSNYNLVMIDGIQVDQFGGDFDFAPLATDGVDRIELTRGSQSALYGSNAVTGAVNIVSRRGVGPPRFTALAEAGSFTTRRFATGGSGLTRGLSWAYNLSRLDSGGVVSNDRYRNQGAFLSLGDRRSARRQLDFHFYGNANDAGAPGPFGSDPDRLFSGIDTLSRDKQNLFGYQGSYAEQFSPGFRQVVTGSVATNDLFFHSPFGDSFSNSLRGVVNTRSEISVSNKDFLVLGIEYNREQIKNTFIANASSAPFLLPRTSLAYFVENRWNPTSRWYVTTGVRLDDIRTRRLPPDAFGSRPLVPANSLAKVNPRVSVAFFAHEGAAGSRRGTTRAHGSFGTGIRSPNGFELAFTNNPRLKPERSVSFDSGIEQRLFGDRAVLDVTYFYNRFEDQIVVLGGSLTKLSSFVSDNLGNARGQGMEFSFRLRPTRSLTVTGEYTLLATTILSLDRSTTVGAPFHVGQQLLRRPRNSGFYGVTWRRRRLMLETDAVLRGSVLDVEPNDGVFACTPPPFGPGLPCFFTNKGYVRADAGFSYQLPRGVEIYGRLNNFLNQKYEESFGFPALHLNFLAGVRFNFPAE